MLLRQSCFTAVVLYRGAPLRPRSRWRRSSGGQRGGGRGRGGGRELSCLVLPRRAEWWETRDGAGMGKGKGKGSGGRKAVGAAAFFLSPNIPRGGEAFVCFTGDFMPRSPVLTKHTLGRLIFPSSFTGYLVRTLLFALKGFGIRVWDCFSLWERQCLWLYFSHYSWL